MSKCPYCFRTIGVWTHDPIILPDGAKYVWSDDAETILVEETDIDERFYKGFQQITIDEVTEIRNILINLEESYISEVNRTSFSPINISGKFQITGTHIKEMRDSVEKLLIFFGMTKLEYFNYDEDENHITNPNGDKIEWTDPIEEGIEDRELADNFQVKYIHIEELRHYLRELVPFRENYESATPTIWSYPTSDAPFIGQDSKTWRADNDSFNNAAGSYIQITNTQSLILHPVASLSSGGLPSIRTFTNGSVLNRVLANQKLYLDILNLNINVQPTATSYDCVLMQIILKNYADSSQFSITYFWNYHPTNFILVQSPLPYTSLEGNLSVGTNSVDLYSDLIGMYSSMIDYYNGVTDDKGCYVYYCGISLGMTGYSSYFHHIEMDNIIVTS